MKLAKCTIKGIVPLLQHRFPEEQEDSKSKKKTGRIDYSLEAEGAIHRNKDGIIFEPSTHIEGSLLDASTSFQIPGKGKKTYKDLILSSIIVEPIEIPIIPQKYEVDRQPVVVNRARVFRYRPRFDTWELSFDVKILDEQFDPEVLEEILVYAGAAKGIGDYRPKFGRFEVTKFEVAK